MKSLFLLLSLMATNAFAAADSVGVFHRPEKVVVLVNEHGSQGRLQGFMDALQAQDQLLWLSQDESIKIQCGRNATDASCTFRFFPSDSVSVESRSVNAFTEGKSLAKNPYEMHFESSNGDKFTLKVEEQGISFWGSKKPL
ncbi:hypothetical protein AZI87_15495 [Bdellovibrio bacteriovorus]|uniref:Uncharacterized protein n=1 Tax=Bdellovibrio bacteriovorus TaxID=959 RepID=A0A150WKK6_BDEBC|nr:hypothetical protein [Bdellovibrio bacteriovorus]KYG62690.1 hypothetical protein AZI87_15495 [Bdellovibrio bacteriovorus]KYG64539.1 hypothetical protein AZI85_03760 [Bdellovibrio bacteriovorus]